MPGDTRTAPSGAAAGAGAAYADAALFMGMNSADDKVRIACKAFFAERLGGRVRMSWEQVGRCDDLVWRFPREAQDAYYPFMDNLHTDMRIERRAYEPADLRHGLDTAAWADLPTHERLLLGMVHGSGGVLYSVSPRLSGRDDLPVRVPAPPGTEPLFPEPLERLYQASLALRLPTEAL
ncbi:DUF6190 family protein [Streptomyces sp. HU2014]|uniref:DUF6190 family protein n=1 Tax=Streptomyces sp. HU2014 TaxID=2939414 RepID=UPI0020100F88|nr:DUF6190 family protein [Streptomyces sp. HU2014]UQI47327.1 DUF6190 family protein [Streptomyces sp. HU2014]